MNAQKRTGEELLAAGYQQVSYRHRQVARLPRGMTGLQALAQAAPDLAKLILDNAERLATEQFLRIFSDDVLQLSEEEFRDFKRADRVAREKKEAEDEQG